VVLARELVKDVGMLCSRRQDKAGVALANQQVITGKEAR